MLSPGNWICMCSSLQYTDQCSSKSSTDMWHFYSMGWGHVTTSSHLSCPVLPGSSKPHSTAALKSLRCIPKIQLFQFPYNVSFLALRHKYAQDHHLKQESPQLPTAGTVTPGFHKSLKPVLKHHSPPWNSSREAAVLGCRISCAFTSTPLKFLWPVQRDITRAELSCKACKSWSFYHLLVHQFLKALP